MKRLYKNILAGVTAACILGTSTNTFAATYEVQSGDTFWKISQKTNSDILELMEVNNATQSTILYVGQKLIVPEKENFSTYEVKAGDTPWLISQALGVSLDSLLTFNGLGENSYIYIGQQLKIPVNGSDTGTIEDSPAPYITYEQYVVRSGDTFWKISMKYGIPYEEILDANNFHSNTSLNVGQTIKIPVHHVPVMNTPGAKYGEYQDWWEGVQYLIPIGATFKVIDFYTGKSFMAQRTIGANHSDTETLTAKDTAIMKEIWGGNFTWSRRPVIIEYNGRRIAASASAMPHAGNDSAPANQYTTWRSGDYGAGTNFDYIKGNGMDGHFDIHFLNSTRHSDGTIDEKHQTNVKIAAGIK